MTVLSLANLDGNNGFRLDGVAKNDHSGTSVSNAGDVNGDGFDDLIIGAPRDNSNGLFSGASYVVFGKASGFEATMNLSNLNGSNGFRLDGHSPTGQTSSAGTSVSTAGDINGDGLDDLIVGDPMAGGGYYRYGPLGYGTSYVIFGRTSGFEAALDLSSLDGNNGFRLEGGSVGYYLGSSVSTAGDVNGDGFDDLIIGVPGAGSSYIVFGKASGFDAGIDLYSLDGAGSSVSDAGDVNGDGFDDVIVGAPYVNPNGKNSGSSYVVFGKASGFDTAIDLSSLNGSNGFRMDGAAEYDNLGKSVSTAGDINGDGFDDLIVGSPGADLNGKESGSSYVVFGQASGFAAEIDLTSLNGSNGFRLDGTDFFHASSSVSTAGDVNGDGFDDLIIGAPFIGYDSQGIFGASYVMFGKVSGFDAVINLASMDDSDGFRLEGEPSGTVSTAGDINDDGFDDLIVGASGADPNGDESGSSFVIFGRSEFTTKTVYTGTVDDDILTGTTTAERFEAGDGNDRMIGRGGADTFQGDAGDDSIFVRDLDFQSVDGGTGTDTLELAGPKLKLNLAEVRGAINGIEVIDLTGLDFTGAGDNTLTLTLQDLRDLSDTTDTFIVNGNDGDHIFGLVDGWVDEGKDGDYEIFTNSGTTLRVNSAVSTDISARNAISLGSLDGSDGVRLVGLNNGDQLGSSVSNAGDVNGDGVDDVIVGALFASSPNGDFSGSSYVVFGKTSGFNAALELSSLDGHNGFRMDGVKEKDFLGSSVSAAGDINGDGFDDLIISASSASYVVFGNASGFEAVTDLSGLNGNNGFRMDGVVEMDQFLESVSNAGDINADGFDDLIVSASGNDSNISCYVVFGKATGFEAAIDLGGLDGSNGFRLDGAGDSVSTAGDVNGDGFDDLIVGASSASSNAYRSGTSYVFFGKAAGFSAEMNLSSLDGSNGFRVDGLDELDSLGNSVNTAGDINGDGFDDLIIGAALASPNGSRSGTSYVIFGKAAGFSAKMDLTSLDGNNGFRVDGLNADDKLGCSVSSAGDINGDGFDDLIIGAYGADPIGGTFPSAGSSYMIFGRASGFSAALDLSNLDSSTGIRLDGAVIGDQSGTSVSGAGDVDGDGYDDLIIGAPELYSNGSSYIVFGSSDFGGGVLLQTIPGTTGDDVLRGTAAAEIFDAADGNDLLIGRGGADVFRGGAGVDQIKVPDLNFASIDGGTGADILHLDGKDLHLDLANLGDKIHGIETICLFGRGDNTLTLTADSVLDLSDTSNTLILHGNAGDHVTVQDDGWVDGGVKGFYHSYIHDDAVLLVGANLTIDFG
ncbi:MAG: beta strand repeat-containing protein [Nitrosomonas sp.]